MPLTDQLSPGERCPSSFQPVPRTADCECVTRLHACSQDALAPVTSMPKLEAVVLPLFEAGTTSERRTAAARALAALRKTRRSGGGALPVAGAGGASRIQRPGRAPVRTSSLTPATASCAACGVGTPARCGLRTRVCES